MKKKSIQNTNGITICDSIVMSVKTKRPNLRILGSVLIALIGFTSVILSFLGMFEFMYNTPAVILASIVFSVFYITLTIIGGRALWGIAGSVLIFVAAVWKNIDNIKDGFKFVYNIVYSASFHTDIKYYKYVDPSREDTCVTTLFILCIWLMAIVIYFFTIHRPNPILPLLVTFPIIEIGLYNGIEIPIFWGILVVGYWLALLSMSTIDVGEYSGGKGGFVRKDDLFFPKRQMRLKVTEKCGLFIIAVVMLIAFMTSIIMRITGYKRSDELNRKRRQISEAMSEFTLENLAESISRLTSAFGFSFSYENNKLGTTDHISYKNETDMLVTVDSIPNGAIYIKDANGCIYDDNEWFDLRDKSYEDPLFYDFSYYGLHVQDFASLFTKLMNPDVTEINMNIQLKLKKDRPFAPYGVDNYGDISYDKDMMINADSDSSDNYSYKFIPIDADEVAAQLMPARPIDFHTNDIADSKWKDTLIEYCNNHDLIEFGDTITTNSQIPANITLMEHNCHLILAELIEERYRQFVYDNYLQIPGGHNMDEVRNEYISILADAKTSDSPQKKLETLHRLRDKMYEDTKYSLSPGKTPSNRDFVNYFLLENKKGYCIHYATSGVILARMAGIPARYATGYIIVGDDFDKSTHNPDGTYTVDVQDNRSHAWIEVYLDGFGWVPFEFTAGYTSRSIVHSDPEPTDPEQPPTETTINTETQPVTSTITVTSYVGGYATTTTTTTTRSGGIIAPGNNGTHSKNSNDTDEDFGFPAWLKNTLLTILFAALFIGSFVLRRYFILIRRENAFKTGASSSRLGAMYAHTERLLEYLKLKNESMNYMEFADKVEQHIGSTHITSGNFKEFVKIALRSGFGNQPPAQDELAFCENTVNELSKNIYDCATLLQKLYLKFISVLV